MTEEAIREMAKALYDRASDETWCDENPSSLKSVWVDGEVDFISLAEAAIAAWNRRAGGEREQQLEAAAREVVNFAWSLCSCSPPEALANINGLLNNLRAALAGQTEGERNDG